MKHIIIIGSWMIEIILVAFLLTSLGYSFPQALWLGSMFMPVLLIMKYHLPLLRFERQYIIGVVCLFFSFLVLEYLLLMFCHALISDFNPKMPSILTNPVFIVLVLAVLLVFDTWIGTILEKRFGKMPASVTFTSERSKITLNTSEILYVESLDTETRLHTLNGEVYRSRTPISQWQEILEDGFLRTHRSFLVNTNHILSASEDEVMLGEITIPISRKYKSQALFKLNNYRMRKN